jgi:hypothetical protein
LTSVLMTSCGACPGRGHIAPMADDDGEDIRRMSGVESLMRCPDCNREMRLFGTESAGTARELYTFECDQCGRLEVRGVRLV